MHKVLPSTALYYKACTKYFPYYKTSTKYFPILFCTIKLAPSTSQYYFVLQSLHKILPNTTLQDKESLYKVLPSTTSHDKSYRPLQCILQHHIVYIDVHGNGRWQQLCSHPTAICNHRFHQRLEQRTHEQPCGVEHNAETNHMSKWPQSYPPPTRAALHRRLQPLYAEKRKTQCFALRLPPHSTSLNFHFP